LLKRNFIIIVLGFSLSALLMACESEAEREREAGRQVQVKTVVAPDGSIHLTPEQAQANGIQTTAVIEQDVAPTITAIGRIRARLGAESQVFSPFPGRVVADPAKLPQIGNLVSQGELLAEVEQILTAAEAVQFSVSSIQLQGAIDQAENEVRLARTELERSKSLYEGGVISLKQWQVAEFNLQQAQARLESARRAKAEYEAVQAQSSRPRRVALRSPIFGVVVAADLTPGQQINTAKSLFTIADLTKVWVEAQVFETDLAPIRQARPAQILTRAYPNEVFTGHLVTIGHVVDPTNRTVTVIFEVANPQQKLKLGMFAEARIPTGKTQRALVIPAQAVLQEEGRSIIYVETEPGVYRPREITIDRREGELVIVTSGVKVGEKVVTVGAQVLRSEASKGQIPSGEEVR
jgi:cobalt-zinc-cadmium efflux system membrane fusion protein